MLVWEIFDNILSYDKNNYGFNIGDIYYRVFFKLNGKKYSFRFYQYKNKNDMINDFDGRDDITGTGNQLKVFSTVIEILKDFIKKENPYEIYFSAKEPSRKKLYSHILKKSNIEGYKIEDRGGYYSLIKNIITELFDKNYNVNINKNYSNNLIDYNFEYNNIKYNVWFFENKGEYTLGFQANDDDILTNLNVSIQIFSIVIKIIKMFIKQYNPEILKFTSEIFREKLYDKLFKLFDADFICSKNNNNNNIEYVLVKKLNENDATCSASIASIALPLGTKSKIKLIKRKK